MIDADWFVQHPRLTVHRWEDATLEEHGVSVRSPYAERFWLPILGPSSLLVLRRVAVDLLTSGGQPIVYDLATLGAELGLPGKGKGIGTRNSALARTLARLVRYGAAVDRGQALAVRTHLAPLTEDLLDRLPPQLREAAGSRKMMAASR